MCPIHYIFMHKDVLFLYFGLAEFTCVILITFIFVCMIFFQMLVVATSNVCECDDGCIASPYTCRRCTFYISF